MRKSRLSHALFGLSLLIAAPPTIVEASPRGTCRFLLTAVLALSQVTLTGRAQEQDFSFSPIYGEQQLEIPPVMQEVSVQSEPPLSLPNIKEDMQEEALKPAFGVEKSYSERRGLQVSDDVVCNCKCGNHVLDMIGLVFLFQIHIAAACILTKVKRDYAIPIEAAPNGKPDPKNIIYLEDIENHEPDNPVDITTNS